MTHGVNLAEVSYKKHVLIFFIPFYLMSFTLKILHVRIRLSVKFCLMVFHNMFIIKGCVSIDFRYFFLYVHHEKHSFGESRGIYT